MKKSTLLLIFFVALFSGAFAQSEPTGSLDQSFGNGGMVTTAISAQGSEIWGMAIQDDWSVVVGGFVYNGVDSDFAVIRYKPDGALDSSFGTNGIVTNPVGSGSEVIYSVAIQPDGKIVAGGIVWNGANADFAMARYTTDGTLDNTFGNNGIVTTAIGAGNDKAFSLKLMDDWSIVMGGITHNGSNNDFALVRYKTDGTLDSTFGTNGIVTTPIGTGNDMGFSVAIQDDWSILLGGVAKVDTGYDFAVARYQINGSLDSTFGTNGKVITKLSNGNDFIWSLVVQADGKIVAGGFSSVGEYSDFALARYNTNGTMDTTFGNLGKVSSETGGGGGDIYSLVVQPDGKLVAGGYAYDGGKENYALARYNTDGTMDNSFGMNGQVITVASTGDNEIYAVALQPDGKIVAAGFANDGTKPDCSLARYISGLSVGVIDFAASNNSMLIYPNPIAQNATLEYTLTKEQVVTIELRDAQGRTVTTFVKNQIQSAGAHQQPLVLPQALASGSYFIVISSPDGKMSISVVK